jgi:hypothetical protein
VSETVYRGSKGGGWALPHELHDEFQELCALWTTGELTAEEWARLSEHLAHCATCREFKQHYEALVARMVPSLAECETAQAHESSSGAWSIEEAEESLMNSLSRESTPPGSRPNTQSAFIPWKRAGRFAIAAVILLASGLAGYQTGVVHDHGRKTAAMPVFESVPGVSSRPSASLTSSGPAEKKAHPEGDEISQLRSQVRSGESEVASLKDRLRGSEDELAQRNAALDRSLEERAEVNRQLTQAEASVRNLEERLDVSGNQASRDTEQLLGFRTQIKDLNSALEDKNREIEQERELLQRDQDIRNLISARNLYIAEIYDVAKTGDTQKPFGRVFYTKDQSLIFYGYDLDQQPGVKRTSTFQAWGRSATDRQRDVSLGLLYQDDTNQKRWVLKFNDPKTIAQIDAVFVTVEPEGGSAKPSGKPLLFTYLRLDPNHP